MHISMCMQIKTGLEHSYHWATGSEAKMRTGILWTSLMKITQTGINSFILILLKLRAPRGMSVTMICYNRTKMQLNLWISTQEHEWTTESNMEYCHIHLTSRTTSDTTASHWKGVAAVFVVTSFKAQHNLLMSKPFTHLKGRHMKYAFPFHSEKPFEKLITSVAKVCKEINFPRFGAFLWRDNIKVMSQLKKSVLFCSSPRCFLTVHWPKPLHKLNWINE